MEATKCGSPEGCHEHAEKMHLNDDKIATNFKGPQAGYQQVFSLSSQPLSDFAADRIKGQAFCLAVSSWRSPISGSTG